MANKKQAKNVAKYQLKAFFGETIKSIQSIIKKPNKKPPQS